MMAETQAQQMALCPVRIGCEHVLGRLPWQKFTVQAVGWCVCGLVWGPLSLTFVSFIALCVHPRPALVPLRSMTYPPTTILRLLICVIHYVP